MIVLHTGDNVNASQDLFVELNSRTTFALILRGDVRFSYRSNEAICSGGIPVLLTDYMVPPLNDALPWESFGVLINETKWRQTKAILDAIPLEHRRRLQLRARHVCHVHFATVPRQIQSVLDTITGQLGVGQNRSGRRRVAGLRLRSASVPRIKHPKGQVG